MPEESQNINALRSKVVKLQTESTIKHSENLTKNGIINLTNENTEVKDMSNDTYTKTEIDSKFDKLNSDIQHGFEKVDLKFEQVNSRFNALEKQVDLKFDAFEKKIENLFLTQENKRLEQQRQDKKEFTYWAIGILIALAGIAFPIWFSK